ncbi:hypothetical protein HK104_010497 [Borealophlyctis nickersoniae]|nr:hypothetical protein HK104_010497 [Borealophlyctis nickersoniae]
MFPNAVKCHVIRVGFGGGVDGHGQVYNTPGGLLENEAGNASETLAFGGHIGNFTPEGASELAATPVDSPRFLARDGNAFVMPEIRPGATTSGKRVTGLLVTPDAPVPPAPEAPPTLGRGRCGDLPGISSVRSADSERGTPDRRLLTISDAETNKLESGADADAENVAVAELAKNSKFKEGVLHWKMLIPMTVLAPLVVCCALIAVLVPNTLIWSTASLDSTASLSDLTLATMMSGVKTKVEASLSGVGPALQALASLPEVGKYMTDPAYTTNLAAVPFTPNLVRVRDAFNLDTLACLTGRWANSSIAYNEVDPAGTNKNTVKQTTITALPDFGKDATNQTIVAILDYRSKIGNVRFVHVGHAKLTSSYVDGTHAFGFHVDQETLTILNPDPATGSHGASTSDNTRTSSVRSQLSSKLVPIRTKPYLTLSVSGASGALTANIVAQQWSYANRNNLLPDYACAASYRIDSSWNAILRASKPLNDSLVALLQPTNLTIAATSNQVVQSDVGTVVNGALKYAELQNDTFTNAVRSSLLTNFGNYSNVIKSGLTYYEDQLMGDTYLIGFTTAAFSTYTETDSLLVVAAVPRSEIFGKLDAARKRSIAVSVGVSVAMGVLASGIFLLLVLPLFRLARSMQMLTKLDFSQLESSGMLGERSWIWELYNVQTTFATMVRAFAGAIKKNKQMVGRAGPMAGSRSVEGNSGGK